MKAVCCVNIQINIYPFCAANSLKVDVVVLSWSQRWIPEALGITRKRSATTVQSISIWTVTQILSFWPMYTAKLNLKCSNQDVTEV